MTNSYPHIHTNSQIEILAVGLCLTHRRARDTRPDWRGAARRRSAHWICGETSGRVSRRAAGAGETMLDALGQVRFHRAVDHESPFGHCRVTHGETHGV
jgi:hypothetical protein